MFNGYNQPMFESDPGRENAIKKPSHVTPWPYSQNFYHNQESPPVSSSSGWHSKSPYPGVTGKCACAQCQSGYHKNADPMQMTTSQERMLFGGSSGGGGGSGSDYTMEGYQRADAYHRGGALIPKGYPSCSYPEPTAQNFNPRIPVVKQHPNADFALERNSEQYMRLFGAPPYGHKLPEQRPKFWDGVNGPFYPNQPYQYPPSSCRYPPYTTPYYYQGSSQPQSFQSQQQSHSGPQPYYGAVPNAMRPMDSRTKLPAHLAKQDNNANKISPLRLMRKKKLAEPAGQLSPPRLAESQSDSNPPLDVRRFLASWADDDEESPPVPQVVVLDCQELNDQQAALLRLYEESTVHEDGTADPTQSKFDNHVEEVEHKPEIGNMIEVPVKNPPVNENPVISNQTIDNSNKLISPPPASQADLHDATPIQPELPTSEYRKNKFLDYDDGPKLPSVVPARPLTPPVTDTLPPKKNRKRSKKPTIKFSIKKSHDLKISLQVMNDGDNDVAPEDTEARSELDPDSRDSMTLQLEDTSAELDLRTKRAKKMKRKRILEEVYSVSSEDQYSDIAADGFQVEESIDSAKIKLTFKRRRGDHDGKRPCDDDLKKAKKPKRLKNLTGNDSKHGSFDAASPGDERVVADTTTDYNGHAPNDEPVFYPAAEVVDAKDPLCCDEPLVHMIGPSNEADSSHTARLMETLNNSNTSSPKITSSCHITSPRTSTDSIERELQAIWNGDDRDASKDVPEQPTENQVSSNVDFYPENLQTVESKASAVVDTDSHVDHDKPLDLRGHSSHSIQDETTVVSPNQDASASEREDTRLVKSELTEIVERVEAEPFLKVEKRAITPEYSESNADQIRLVENDLRLSTDSCQRNDEPEQLTEGIQDEEVELAVNEPEKIDEMDEREETKPSNETNIQKIEKWVQEKENLILDSQRGQEQNPESNAWNFFPNDDLEEEHSSQKASSENNRDSLVDDGQTPVDYSDESFRNTALEEQKFENVKTDLNSAMEQNVLGNVSLDLQESLVEEPDDFTPAIEQALNNVSNILFPRASENNSTEFDSNVQQTENEPTFDNDLAPQISIWDESLTPERLQATAQSPNFGLISPVQERTPAGDPPTPNSDPMSPFTERKDPRDSPNNESNSLEMKGPRTPAGGPLTPNDNSNSPVREKKGSRTPCSTPTNDFISPYKERKGPRTPAGEPPTPNNDVVSPVQEREGPRTPAREPPTPNNNSNSPVQERKGSRTPAGESSTPTNDFISPYKERKGPRTPAGEPPTPNNDSVSPAQERQGPRTPAGEPPTPNNSVSPVQERQGPRTPAGEPPTPNNSVSPVQERQGPRTPAGEPPTPNNNSVSPGQERDGPRTPAVEPSTPINDLVTPFKERKGPRTPAGEPSTPVNELISLVPERKGPRTPAGEPSTPVNELISLVPERDGPRTPVNDLTSPFKERKGPRTPAGEPLTPNHYASSCFSSPQSHDSLSPKNCGPEATFTYRRGPRTPEDEPLSSDCNSPGAFYHSPVERQTEPETRPRTPEEIQLKIESVTEELVLAASFRGPQTPECEESENLTELEIVKLDQLANDSEDLDSDPDVDFKEIARFYICVPCLSPIRTPPRVTENDFMNEPEELAIENFELVEESVEWVSDENANIILSNHEINIEEQEIVIAVQPDTLVVEPAEETLAAEPVTETVETSNKNVINDDYELEEGEIVDEYVLLEISDDDDVTVTLDVGEIPLPLGEAPKENCFDLEKIREMRKAKELQSIDKACEAPQSTEVLELCRNPSPPGTPSIQSPTQLPDDTCVDLKELCCDEDADVMNLEEEIVNAVEPAEEIIVVEPAYELEEDVVPNDAKFQDVMANCLANAEKFLDREDGETEPEDINRSMSSRDVLLCSSLEAPSDMEICGDASSGEVSLDFSPCYTALGTESLPVDNWPYLEEEVPLSPDWPDQEDVPLQEDIPGHADLNLSHPLLPKKMPALPISNPSVKKSKIRRRTVEAVNQTLAPKFSSERQCTDSDVELDLVKEKFKALQRRGVYMNAHWQPKVVLSRVAASTEASSPGNALQSDCEQAFPAVKPDRHKEAKVKPGNAQLVQCYDPSLPTKEIKRTSSQSSHRSAVKSESHSSEDNDKRKLIATHKKNPGKIFDDVKGKNSEKRSGHRKAEPADLSREKKSVDPDKGRSESRPRKASETDSNSRPKISAKIPKNVEKVMYSKTHLDRPDGKVLEDDVSGKNKMSPSMKVLPSPVKRSHDSHRSPRRTVEKSSSKRQVAESPSKRVDRVKFQPSSSPHKVPNESPKKDVTNRAWICEVCNFDNEDERNDHVQTHPFHCLLCHLAFISEANFTKHLEERHQDLRALHHCMLCELSFETTREYGLHLESREHLHLEAVERNTINTLFELLTGDGCPSMGSKEPRPKWLPSDPGVVHFYHQPTPLSKAIQYWNEKTDLKNP